MIEKMETKLKKFQGDGSRVRCFAHVVNLVARSVISQFDVPKSKENSASDHEKAKERSAAKDDVLDAPELDEDGYEVPMAADSGDVEDIDAILAGGDEDLQKKLAAVRALAGDLEEQRQKQRQEEAPEEQVNDEEDDGWVDERWSLDEDELKELSKEVMPARRMLVKVCGCLLVHVLQSRGVGPPISEAN